MKLTNFFLKKLVYSMVCSTPDCNANIKEILRFQERTIPESKPIVLRNTNAPIPSKKIEEKETDEETDNDVNANIVSSTSQR